MIEYENKYISEDLKLLNIPVLNINRNKISTNMEHFFISKITIEIPLNVN